MQHKANRRRRNPELTLTRSRRWKYGLTYDAFLVLWEAQDGCCAICRRPFASEAAAHVDHDHATHVIRGLLCRGCNLGLGAFQDKPRRLERAARYLRDNSIERLSVAHLSDDSTL